MSTIEMEFPESHSDGMLYKTKAPKPTRPSTVLKRKRRHSTNILGTKSQMTSEEVLL